MKPVRVLWGADSEATAASAEKLRELLARLDAERVDGVPLMVGLEAPRGSLAVGLGDRQFSVLVYVPSGEGDDSFHSAGTEPERGRAPAYLTMLGEYSEFSWSSVIARADAEEAIEFFVDSEGSRPPNVRWEPD